VTPASSAARASRAGERTSIVHHDWRCGRGEEAKNAVANQKRRFERKPVLASDDETRSRWAQKFFYAKNRDSESAQHAFSPPSVSRRSVERVPVNRCSNEKMPAAQSLSAILTIACVRFSYAIGIAAPMYRGVIDQRAHALSHRHVNTSLSGTLFFLLCGVFGM